MTGMHRKIDLYILSLGLLFIFIFIITVKLTSPFSFSNYDAWKELATSNLLPIVSVFFLFYCWVVYARFEFDSKGAHDTPFEIKKLENINYEHLTFLATHVVPLISFNFNDCRQLIVLTLLLVAMGAIYIKTDLFYANPSLALLGFRIYRAGGHFKGDSGDNEREGIILICRERLAEKQKVLYIKLDERIYYVRSVK